MIDYMQHYDSVTGIWRKVNRETGEIVDRAYERYPDIPVYHSPAQEDT